MAYLDPVTIVNDARLFLASNFNALLLAFVVIFFFRWSLARFFDLMPPLD